MKTGKSMELVGTNATCGRINGRRAIQRITVEWGASETSDARGVYRCVSEQPNSTQAHEVVEVPRPAESSP